MRLDMIETRQIPIFAQWHIHSHAPIGIGAALNSEGLHGCGVHDFPCSAKAQCLQGCTSRLSHVEQRRGRSKMLFHAWLACHKIYSRSFGCEAFLPDACLIVKSNDVVPVLVRLCEQILKNLAMKLGGVKPNSSAMPSLSSRIIWMKAFRRNPSEFGKHFQLSKDGAQPS